MFCCKIKSKKSNIIFIYWSCRAFVYTKPSCHWIYFNDCSDHLAYNLCLCEWLFSGEKYYCHLDMCNLVDSDIFHLLWKLKSIRYRRIHSINCHLYWDISHSSINMEFWFAKFKCFHNDSVHWNHIFGSLHFRLCNG